MARSQQQFYQLLPHIGVLQGPRSFEEWSVMLRVLRSGSAMGWDEYSSLLRCLDCMLQEKPGLHSSHFYLSREPFAGECDSLRTNI
ncbi:hypothetical protein M8818_004937 [Zalaria obscura]|uniref:Uncharacterized protein n=1 Tax=Zalaria obscura TaxID=2024903 RepID=A0ACC3SAG7_9PEZI